MNILGVSQGLKEGQCGWDSVGEKESIIEMD